ncbi:MULTISPECIES: LysR family transcriptional regulator [unclassified Pseudophaeobacter]|uniref:LysR family transcriptional regulator n=1 Tax=unclassified Pseudophaeobacter TaxID=2637024 RepID=UPI000EFD9DCE|nr:LysR family transcriptional regulator [Pseudophaeobacter sp. EL27]
MLRYTLRQLEYFVAVGEAGSIALASEQVNVSSPSISSAINQLEKEFGMPLFVRQHAQGLSLSQAGRIMLEQAKLVLKEAEGMMALAGDISGVVRGRLSVGCLITFAQVLLPTVRRSFEQAFPEVNVHQKEANQSEIFSLLRRAEIDVALTYDLNLPADLQFTSLLELPPFAIVDVAHPLSHLPAVSVAELNDYPMVLLDLPFSSDYFLSFFAKINAVPNVAERTKDMAVMRSLVANGFGYSIANVRPVNDRAPDGKPLKFIPLVGDVRPMRMGLLMSNDADSSSVVRAFAKHCSEELIRTGFPGLDG